MKSILRIAGIFLGEILIIAICVYVIVANGDLFLLDYYYQLVPFLGIAFGTIAILFISGLLRDFVKSLALSVKASIGAAEGKKACLALQCAMTATFMWSVFATIAGVVAAQNGLILNPVEQFAVADITALCAALPASGMMIILLLCPIYYRIRRLIIEQNGNLES